MCIAFFRRDTSIHIVLDLQVDIQVDHNVKEGRRENFHKLAQNYWVSVLGFARHPTSEFFNIVAEISFLIPQ
jgi:hypothetical protein